jgi:hypothetical protein
VSESAPRPRRSFHSEVFAEQYRVQGGAEADPQAILKLDLKDVAKVYERNGLREIYLSERIREAQLQLEARLSGDDYRRLDKQRHVQILALFRRIQTVAELGELASGETYADLGRAVVELLGTPLSHAASGYMHYKTGLGKEDEAWRNKVPELQADISLALHHLGQMTNGELRRSMEATRRGAAISYIEDCLARELRLPDEREIMEHLARRGHAYSGSTERSIERQWNRLFRWCWHLFRPPE